MANPFSEAQKASIRNYLGYPSIFLQTFSDLEMSMLAVQNITDPATYNLVVGWLSSLAVIEAQIVDAYTRIQADEVDSMKLGRMSEINILRSEGRRFVGRISALFNVGIRNDVFSGTARQTQSNYLRIV